MMDKKKIILYILILLTVSGFVLLLLKLDSISNQLETVQFQNKILERQRDSLRDEVFYLDIEMSRYERSTEHLGEIDSEAAEEWLRYYTQETE